MRAMALDTTTRSGSVAIVDDGGTAHSRVGDETRSHAERLPGELIDALRVLALTPRDIDVFGVVAGPGGFTGLRIGIAAIQGLAVVTGRRVVAIPTLLAIAVSAAEGMTPGAAIGVWLDAHRGEVFTGRWTVTEQPAGSPGHLVEVEPVGVDSPSAVRDRWASDPPAVIVGDGAVRYAALAESIAVARAPSPLAPVVGRMAIAWALAGLSVDPSGLQPIYVRRLDAEVVRDEKRARERAAAGPVS